MKRKFSKFVALLLVFTMLTSLVACAGSAPVANPSTDERVILAERFLEEEFLYESFLEEIFLDETFIHEIFMEEKLWLEAFIEEQLMLEEVVRDVLLVETIFIPEGAVYTDIDVTLLNELFGHDIEISSLLTRFAVGGGVVLTLTILDTFLPVGTVATLVASAARGARAGATIGGGIGTLSGAGAGFFDAIDETGRITALGYLGLSIVGVITSALALKAAIPTGGASLSVPLMILSSAGLGASLFGVGYTGHNAALTFMSTESIDIDWNNIDWGAVGYATAVRAIDGMTDGVLFGAVIGSFYESARTVVRVDGKTVIQDPRGFDPTRVEIINNTETVQNPDGTTILRTQQINRQRMEQGLPPLELVETPDGIIMRRTNIQRMEQGLAPIGRDGYSVNIHHINQTDDGAVLEITTTAHRQNHSRLHRNPGGQNAPPSEIDRPGFNI